MKNLLYKELTLSIHKFFFLLPIILGALFFIPGWIYLLVFMYFFWISIPQIFAGYLSNGDYQFTTTLPIQRKDIVTAKALSIYILEGIHIVFAAIFAVAHNLIYGGWNLFFDVNLAFFGIAILMFSLFNVIFITRYFKTAHYFGMATIYGTVATLIFGFIFEYGVIRYQFMRNIFEGNLQSQLIPFSISIVLSIFLNWYTIKKSQASFMKIDL